MKTSDDDDSRRKVLSRAYHQARRFRSRSVDVPHPQRRRVQIRSRAVRDTWAWNTTASASSARTRSHRRPSEDEVEFFFELVPQGALTPLLHKMQPGDQLLMRKVPKGRFSLDTATDGTNHLLISTVTGVAPFVSYVRTLSQRLERRPLRRHRTNCTCSTAPAVRGNSDT